MRKNPVQIHHWKIEYLSEIGSLKLDKALDCLNSRLIWPDGSSGVEVSHSAAHYDQQVREGRGFITYANLNIFFLVLRLLYMLRIRLLIVGFFRFCLFVGYLLIKVCSVKSNIRHYPDIQHTRRNIRRGWNRISGPSQYTDRWFGLAIQDSLVS